MKPVFSVVIPVLNGRSSIELVLRCLQAQTFSRDRFECLIVDDGSTDGTVNFLKSYKSDLNLRCFFHKTNKGRSEARNTACSQAQGEILAFLDADMLPEPDWLENYYKAFERSGADVVSGGRYHVDLGTQPLIGPEKLAAVAGTDTEALFQTNVAEQFQRIAAAAGISAYPSLAMQKFEEQLPAVCAAYPDSLICAYTFISGNVAVKTDAFNKTGGFECSIRRGEDTEMGVRLWELGAKFAFAEDAKAYHMFFLEPGGRHNTLAERLAFFYRHPYSLVIMINLWFAYNDQSSTSRPSIIFNTLKSLIAAEPDFPDMDLRDEFYQVYQQALPAECIYSQSFMIDYYNDLSGVEPELIKQYLEYAVISGLIVRRIDGELYFDFNHTTNWLRKNTPFQQYEYQHTRYNWLRRHIPTPDPGWKLSKLVDNQQARFAGVPLERDPVTYHCQGRYQITIPKNALPKGQAKGAINIPLPIAHQNQTDLKITSCYPENLMQYADAGKNMIYGLPLQYQSEDELLISYEFSCTLHEHISKELPQQLQGQEDFSKYLKPSYPASQIAKAEAILEKIFVAPVDNSVSIARAIYKWINSNTTYLQSQLGDHMILETRFGPCSHLARLFVNLCRLMRVPARESCGALLSRPHSADKPNSLLSTGRVYNILNHTWAEFYDPAYGWVPVDFTANDLGKRILTAANIKDEALRSQITEDTSKYDDYYFGNLDAFRIYTTLQANRIPTYPIMKLDGDQETTQKFITQVRHSLTCDVTLADANGDITAATDMHSMVPADMPDLQKSIWQPLLLNKRLESVKHRQHAKDDKKPLRVVLTSMGSTGDAQPFFALAEELRRHGHKPIVALSSHYEKRARYLGFEFIPVGTADQVNTLHDVGSRQMKMENPIEQVRDFLETTMPMVPQMYNELLEICKGADVLVSTPFQFAARMVADATGIPFVSVHLSPFGSKGGKEIREVSAEIVNRYRIAEGLPLLSDPLGEDGTSSELALYAVSTSVFRPPNDWPPHYHVTGYFFLDEEVWQPAADLQSFVESGDAPVVFSFGSMPSDDPKALTQLIVDAMTKIGCRAVIQHGGGNLGKDMPLPDHILAVDFIPHRWLFPRAACIVHHGGAGTSAGTFRAGVPSVFVPHLLDQPIWGEYARSLGCASAVIPIGDLTADNLSEAVAKAMNSRHQRMAAKVKEQIDVEDGVGTARQLIEQLVEAN